MNRKIKIGTRGSLLAVCQAEIVRDRIVGQCPQCEVEIITIKTKGDKILNQSLDKIGGKGVFIKEIETALLDGSIDIAVHSLKDMSDEMPQELMLGAVLERENPMDVLITKDGKKFSELPKGAKIGTGSLRRKLQLLSLRPDLEILPIRGNIHTRLRKMEESMDGIVLAAAGLIRCGLKERISYYFELDEMIPASGQGVLALQIRSGDMEVRELVAKFNDAEADVCQKAERAFLKRIGADCHTPAGALARKQGDVLQMRAMYVMEKLHIVSGEGSLSQAEKLGVRLAEEILEKEKGEKI